MIKGFVAFIIIALFCGCGTVSVQAEKNAHCDFKTEAPFSVVCTSDGEEVLNWSGNMDLEIAGCCDCPEEAAPEASEAPEEAAPEAEEPEAEDEGSDPVSPEPEESEESNDG